MCHDFPLQTPRPFPPRVLNPRDDTEQDGCQQAPLATRQRPGNRDIYHPGAVSSFAAPDDAAIAQRTELSILLIRINLQTSRPSSLPDGAIRSFALAR